MYICWGRPETIFGQLCRKETAWLLAIHGCSTSGTQLSRSVCHSCLSRDGVNESWREHAIELLVEVLCCLSEALALMFWQNRDLKAILTAALLHSLTILNGFSALSTPC